MDLIYIGDSIVEFFETQGLGIFQRWEKPSAERDVLAKANEIISRLDDGKNNPFHSGIRIDCQSHLAPPLHSKSSDDAKFLAVFVQELLQLKSRLNSRMHGSGTS